MAGREETTGGFACHNLNWSSSKHGLGALDSDRVSRVFLRQRIYDPQLLQRINCFGEPHLPPSS